MARQRSSRSFLTVVPFFALALAAAACDSGGETDESTDWSTPLGGGGGTTSGGSTGGAPGGGTGSGSAAGGSASGGTASGGGALFGGSLAGGSAAGGIASGGSASGGTASGGTASGGTASGGSASGGTASGGTASGGSMSGGSTSGGSTSGGSMSGGSTSGGGRTAGGGTTGAGGTAGGRTGGGTTAGGGTTGGRLGGLFGGGAGGTVDYKAGDCCKDSDCSKCITEPPMNVSGAQRGPWGGFLGGGGTTIELSEATVYVPPADAKGPWAGFAIIPGFTNVGPEMAAWGPFFSGWGIVTAVTWSGALDTPGLRGQWLLDAVEAMKKAPGLQGKMSGNYGTGGYSMGGGGTTVASSSNKALRSSIGLAPWAPSGAGITTPTIHFCGTIDVVADCGLNATWAYNDLPDTTPKALVVVSGCDHLTCWFGPADTTGGISGQLGLIWNKVYLEGDSRWKKLLLDDLKGGLSYSVETTVK